MPDKDAWATALERHRIPTNASLEVLKLKAQGLELDLYVQRTTDGWEARLLKVPQQATIQAVFVPCVGAECASAEQEAGARVLGTYLLEQGRGSTGIGGSYTESA